jgi:dihydrolipoamide dehydrogenase
MPETKQLTVIGAGPGGYAAAFLAADHGMDVTLIEQEEALGGVCLNKGCIPSKTLLHFAKLMNEAADAGDHGVIFEKPRINLDAIRAHKDTVIKKLCSGVESLAKARRVKVLKGRATFESSTRLRIHNNGDTQSIESPLTIIATGSRPATPAAFQIGDERVMDSTGALALADIPPRLLVIGGGYIGLEMGSVYAALGSEVTVVEFADGILMAADRDLVAPLEKRLRAAFKDIRCKTKVLALKAEKNGIHVTLEDPAGKQTTEIFDRVLVSTGRRPNSENLGLENTTVKINAKGFIEVDKKMRTADPHILAIGDIAGEPMLAHKASKEARVAVEAILGQPAEFDSICIPAVVFTDPELAWAGVTEADVKRDNLDAEIVKFPWAASGRALSIGRTEGITKVIYDRKTERVIGVGIVGAGAGELIAEGALAIETAITAGDLGGTIHAHPTLSETLMETAELLHGTATHLIAKKR